MTRIAIIGGDLTMFQVGTILKINGDQVAIIAAQQNVAGEYELDVERYTAAQLTPAPDAPRWQAACPYLKRKKGRS